MALKDTEIRALKPREKNYRKADSGGLYLEVFPNGSKLWRWKFRVGGKEKRLALGAYPTVSLKDARAKRDEERAKLLGGMDPALERKRGKVAAKISAANTFAAVAREYIETKMVGEARAKATVSKAHWFLEQLEPAIGTMPIAEVDQQMLLAALMRVQMRGRYETAKKCRSFASRVFRYAAATGRCSSDPAHLLKGALTTPKAKHYAAKRLILVGDHNQLPPIGRGRVFSDVIDWLRREEAPNLAVLETNMRQMENRLDGRGEGILGLAELFLVDPGAQGEQTSAAAEGLLQRAHQGGQLDQDLNITYWNTADDLVDSILADLTAALPAGEDSEPLYKAWRKEVMLNRPERLQVLTPHRGEMHGVDALNVELQAVLTNNLMDRVGAIDGITLNDKVIQIQNRTSRRGLWAYDFEQKKARKVELFNGEIGYVEPHNYDRADLKKVFSGYSKKRLKRFQVKYARKEKICVNYGRDLPTDRQGKSTSQSVESNLELAYAISIHKSQGSEFEQTFVVLPASRRPLATELLYTALTRAQGHCRLYVQGNIAPLLDARRRENAQSLLVSSSLFGNFRTVDERLLNREGWYESGKIHEALSGDMVRSKSEVIIANLLHQAGVPFTYEEPLYAEDGSFYLPDFTLRVGGERFFWEHWGMLTDAGYLAHRAQKAEWYQKHFPGRLVETEESGQLSAAASELITKLMGGS